jgi:hypothetical protein
MDLPPQLMPPQTFLEFVTVTDIWESLGRLQLKECIFLFFRQGASCKKIGHVDRM